MKEIVRLMEQGQLTLQVATELAEKHTGGRALVARCEIENSATEAPSPVKPLGGPSADVRQAHERRLIYYVDCFAGDRLTTVGVDGLTHKVVDSPTPSKPRGQEKSKPKTDKP